MDNGSSNKADFFQHSNNNNSSHQPSKEQTGLLVLTRRLNETICIGDDITITIFNINENQVKLGISAPKEISIWRKEIFPNIHP